MTRTKIQYTANHVFKAQDEAIRLRLPDVELTLDAIELPKLADDLKKIDGSKWHLHLVVKRNPGDGLNGQWIAHLKQNGVESITTSLALDAHSPDQTINELHFLREAACHYLQLHWTLTTLNPVDCVPLVHCPAPDPIEGPLAQWRNVWIVNQINEGLTYRRGPGFVLIRDKRPTLVPQLFQTQDQEDLDLFWLTREPIRMDELVGRVSAERITMFLEYGLLINVGDWILNLVNPANLKIIPYL